MNAGAPVMETLMSVKKIGIIFGMENTFPPALVEKINSWARGSSAEFVKVGGDPHGSAQRSTTSSSTASRRTFRSTAHT